MARPAPVAEPAQPSRVPVLPEHARQAFAWLDELRQFGTALKFRRRQPLHHGGDDERAVYVVASGAAFVELNLGPGRRQILSLLLAGDAIDSGHWLACAACRLIVCGPAELVRIREEACAAMEQRTPLLAKRLSACCAGLLSEALVHHGCIGRLNSEERVASYLIEMGRRTGMTTSAAGTLDVPLARQDVADYLALNPDTLSRIMSRLRSDGALGRGPRGKLIVRDWSVLRAMTPAAETIWTGQP